MESTSSRYSARLEEKCWYSSGFVTPGRLGDVVHRRGPVPALREELEGDGEELVPPLLRREPPCGGLHRTCHRRSGYRRVMRTWRRPGSCPSTRSRRLGQVGQVEVGRGDPVVVLEQPGLGVGQPRGERGRRRHRTSGIRSRPARPPRDRRRRPAGGDGSPTPPRGCRSPPTSRAARRRRMRRRRPRWCSPPAGGPSSTGHRAPSDQGASSSGPYPSSAGPSSQ